MTQFDADMSRDSKFIATLDRTGAVVLDLLDYVGGLAEMFARVNFWVLLCLVGKVRFGWMAVYQQLVRVGVRSVGIITLVSGCIGFILVFQMAPPLEDYSATDQVASINAIAVLRELGPLISAIVLTGFAGASIAAELGTMVVGEEIEALEAMALNPVRFLVLPRVVATVIGLGVLAIFADVIAIGGGAVIGVTVLDIPWGVYYNNTLNQANLSDFITGIIKACVFGNLIGLIACYNGLRVSGGAAGVGRATTMTVVHSIVSIIIADLAFTILFFALGWN